MEVVYEDGTFSVVPEPVEPVSDEPVSPSVAATVVKIGTNADKMICTQISNANSFLFSSLALSF